MAIKNEPRPILKPVVVDETTRQRLERFQEQLPALERTALAEVKAEGKYTIEVQDQLDRLEREISRIPGFNRMSAAEKAAASTHVPGVAWLHELRRRLEALVDDSSTRRTEAGKRAETASWVNAGAEGQQLVTDAGVNPVALWAVAERLGDLYHAGGAAADLAREVEPEILKAQTALEASRGQSHAGKSAPAQTARAGPVEIQSSRSGLGGNISRLAADDVGPTFERVLRPKATKPDPYTTPVRLRDSQWLRKLFRTDETGSEITPDIISQLDSGIDDEALNNRPPTGERLTAGQRLQGTFSIGYGQQPDVEGVYGKMFEEKLVEELCRIRDSDKSDVQKAKEVSKLVHEEGPTPNLDSETDAKLAAVHAKFNEKRRAISTEDYLNEDIGGVADCRGFAVINQLALEFVGLSAEITSSRAIIRDVTSETPDGTVCEAIGLNHVYNVVQTDKGLIICDALYPELSGLLLDDVLTRGIRETSGGQQCDVYYVSDSYGVTVLDAPSGQTA
jgi:hypothetical protein